MNASLIDTRAHFDALRDGWDSLYRDDPAAHVFLSHRWLSDLHTRRPGVCTLVWSAGGPEAARRGALDAVLPLRPVLALDRERRRFRQEMLLAGSHWADRTGALCRPGHEREALPALGRALAALPWERLGLDGLAIDGIGRTLLLGAFDTEAYRVEERVPRDNGGATRLDRAPRVRLPDDFDTWLGHLGAGTRQRVRRFRRRLANDPRAAIRDSVASTREHDPEAFRRLWLARWAEAKGEEASTKADKYVRILGDGLRAGHLRLTSLDVDGSPVALHALYDDPVTATVSFFAGARDERHEALPTGLLLHADAIERAIRAERRTYDLLRGDEPYKYRLGATDAAPLLSLRVRRLPPRVEDVLLEPRWRDEALATIDRVSAGARDSTVEALYSQLLESWPGERHTLERLRARRAARSRDAPAAPGSGRAVRLTSTSSPSSPPPPR